MNREHLLEILTSVMPGVADDNHVEQGQCFIFQNGKVYAFNDSVMVSHPIDDIGFTGAVTAKPFVNILKKMKDEDVTVEVENGQVIINKKKRAKVKLNLEEQIRIPVEKIEAPGEFMDIPHMWMSNLRLASEFSSTDMSVRRICHIHITDSYMEATDNFKFIRIPHEFSCGDRELMVPIEVVDKIKQYEPAAISIGEAWIHMKCQNGVMVQCRLSTGTKYPDTSKAFQTETLSTIRLPTDLCEILDRADVFLKDLEKPLRLVTVQLMENQLVLTSSNSAGSFEESVRLIYKGPPITFMVNAGILRGFIKHAENELKVCARCLVFTTTEYTAVLGLLIPTKED